MEAAQQGEFPCPHFRIEEMVDVRVAEQLEHRRHSLKVSRIWRDKTMASASLNKKG
jgi:hypothetical protein